MSDKAVDQIVAEAEDAFEAARDTSGNERAAWLRAIAGELEQHADELVGIAHEETHLAPGRLRSELTRSTFQLELFADEITRGEHLDATIDHADPDWGMGPRPDLRRLNVPLGVVAVYGASNFPFAFSVMGGDTASALAAGCAVVHKVHEAHARLGRRTAEIVTAALDRAGGPRGLFSTVYTRGEGEALVDHRGVRAVGFTGSTLVGRALFDRASRRPEPIPFFGELGSVNPVFVTRAAWAARADAVVAEYTDSFTLGVGQFCTKPGVLFAPSEDADVLAARFERALAQVTTAPMLTESIAAGFEAVVQQVASSSAVRTIGSGGGGAPARVLLTTARAVREDEQLISTEMFGPATLVVQYEPEDDLPELARLFEGQLTATIIGEPEERPTALLAALRDRAGRVLWNEWPTGVTVSYAQQHGGPYPATTAAATTSVGTAAIARFMRPVAFQSYPDELLPLELQEANPLGISRRVDGVRG